MNGDDVHRHTGAKLIDCAHATDHVDAVGDHGGSVDDRADGFVGPPPSQSGQPDVDRICEPIFHPAALRKEQSDGVKTGAPVYELVLRDHAGERCKCPRNAGADREPAM